MADEKPIEALSATVNALSEGLDERIANAVAAAMKPLLDAQKAQADAVANAEKAELDGLREKIVKANLLTEAAAGELTINAARDLAKLAEPGKAAAIGNGANPAGNSDDEFAGYDINALVEGK